MYRQFWTLPGITLLFQSYTYRKHIFFQLMVFSVAMKNIKWVLKNKRNLMDFTDTYFFKYKRWSIFSNTQPCY
jgi:hypothetical protein